MDDQELRDKLASEGIISQLTGELIPRWHQADFKAGWEAARANTPDFIEAIVDSAYLKTIEEENETLRTQRDQLQKEIVQYKDLIDMQSKQIAAMDSCLLQCGVNFDFNKLEGDQSKYLLAERDQLRAEVEHLKHELYNRIPIKIESPEYNELKSQCEKLAEAHKKIMKLYLYAGKQPTETEWLRYLGAQAGQISADILAEYRKTKGE